MIIRNSLVLNLVLMLCQSIVVNCDPIPGTKDLSDSDISFKNATFNKLDNDKRKNFQNDSINIEDTTQINDFLYLDDDFDLEVMFTELPEMHSEGSSSTTEEIVLQIDDIDEQGNENTYFIHSPPQSKHFLQTLMEKLGLAKYLKNHKHHKKHHDHATLRNKPMKTQQQQSPGAILALFDKFKSRIKAIYPGTVWCGDGNQAKSENDIGFFYMTDTCCRAHDRCAITIPAGGTFDRLKNNGYFTRSHCDCDKQFYNCLKNANTLVSSQIGYTYFNLLKPQCFRYEHPTIRCTKKKKGKCMTYVVAEEEEKQWQWFDNQNF